MKFTILILFLASSLLAIPVTPKEEITYHQVEGKLGKTVAEMWQRMKDNGATPEEQEHFLKKENDGLTRLFTKISSKFGEEVAEQYIRMKGNGATEQELGVYLAALTQSVRRPEGRNPERITMKKEITYQRVEEELGKPVAEMWQRKKDNGATPEQLDHFLEKENRGLTRLFTKISNKFGEEVAEQYIRMKGSGATEQELGVYLAVLAQSVRRPEEAITPPRRHRTEAEELLYTEIRRLYGQEVAEEYFRMKDGISLEVADDYLKMINDSVQTDPIRKMTLADEMLFHGIKMTNGENVARKWWRMKSTGIQMKRVNDYLETMRNLARDGSQFIPLEQNIANLSQ